MSMDAVVNTIKESAVYAAVSEATNFVLSNGYLGGYTVKLAPAWALGAAAATAVVTDKVASKAINWTTGKVGEYVTSVNGFVTNSWTQDALRLGVDAAASSAVGVYAFGAGLTLSALAPYVAVGALPVVAPRVASAVYGLFKSEAAA